MNGRFFVALPLIAMVAASCGRPPLSGPPELHLGRDECGTCGMILNEDRCAAAMLVEQDGQRRHLVFDDIGCMLDFEPGSAPSTIIATFVRDYEERAWVDASLATYLTNEKIATPMGYGFIAFARRERAVARQAAVGGELLDYDAVVKRRAH